ncbi:fluoride efflux transporter FluC [Corynebacterium auriscanis]|uniref:fluoride efflux transporter FluC n=1 Tax=Corynebacterium auriscanis TaxID=99807 RepID=UPI002246DA17|nr:CrcB family protein [Corynebacterium auriscanis]MCX2163681.1 CrcB family protein [Corynebacterium auriscanis]
MNSLLEIFAVMIGGGLGAITRFAVDRRLKSSRVGMSPLTSLTVINVAGSAALGLLLGATYVFTGMTPLASQGESLPKVSSYNSTVALLITFWGTGFCGGFTTFSTAIVEALPPRFRSLIDATPNLNQPTSGPSRWVGMRQLVVMTAASIVAALLGYVAALLIMSP